VSAGKLLHYEIVEPLGEGGMGVVYKARDPRLQRTVALKVLPAHHSSDPVRRARLLREARAAAALNHPHIVTVHDIASEGDTDFIVMEHVSGRPLGKLIPERGLPLAEALRIGTQVADALAAAHAAGVVHRDMKPSNVVIAADGRAKVLDFGLATLASEDDRGAAERLTREGAIVGTITYMSPEQSVGQPADARSDMFSFGLVLYEMLAGSPPFKARSTAEHFHMLNYSIPPPLRTVRPAVPEALEQVVSRMLARRPEDRFAEMRDVERELARLLAEAASAPAEEWEPVDPEAVTLDPDAAGRVRPSATATRPGAPTRPPAPGSERASIAVLPFASLSADPDDAFTAAGIASEIIVALGGVPDLRVASELASFRFRDKEQDLAEIAAKLHTRYVLTGSLRRSGDRIRVLSTLNDAEGGAQIWSKAYDRRLADLFAVQEEIAQAIVGATGGEIIRADAARLSQSSPEQLDAWGLLHRAYHFWNHAFSREGLEQALVQARRAVELDPSYAAAHAFLGLYLIQRVIHLLTPHVEEERREALRAAEQAVELAPRDPKALENAGLVFYHSSLHERSLGVLRRAVEIAPFNLVAWGYLALSLGIAGDDKELAEGRRILDRLLETTPDHPSAPYWSYFKGGLLTRQGALEEAIEHVRRTLELQPYFFLAAVMLANALGASGRLDEARASWQRVAAIHPGFTAAGYAHDIALQAITQERAEPHLAGLRAAGLLT